MGKHRVAPVCPQPPPHPFKVKPLGGGGVKGGPSFLTLQRWGAGGRAQERPPHSNWGGKGQGLHSGEGLGGVPGDVGLLGRGSCEGWGTQIPWGGPRLLWGGEGIAIYIESGASIYCHGPKLFGGRA